MIDIIVPAYNAHDTIIKTLASIALQNIKDKFNVYVVDDCSLVSYDKEVELFKNKLNIKILRMKKNSGPGAARQFGIDNSNGEYIVFIDSDDLFVDCYSVENLYNAIISDDYDKVTGIMLEQVQDYVQMYTNNQCVLHGKIYKRKFIEKYNFRFNNTSQAEDEAYNKLLILGKPKSLVIDNYIYLYCNNKNSITRKDPEFWFYFIEKFVNNMVWVVKEAEIRNFDSNLIACHILREYFKVYSLYSMFYDREDSNLILMWAKQLHEYYLKYRCLLSTDDIININIENINNYGFNIEISFFDFVNQVDLLII